MDRLHRLRRQLRARLKDIRTGLQQLRERARQWWQWHWTRVAEEHGYAEALTAVVLEVVALLTRSIRIRYAAHEFLAVYVAVLKTLRRRGTEPDPA